MFHCVTHQKVRGYRFEVGVGIDKLIPGTSNLNPRAIEGSVL